MTNVHLESNVFSNAKGGAVYTQYACDSVTFTQCTFLNNTSIRGAAIYIDDNDVSNILTPNYCFNNILVFIENTTFHHNIADDSIIYFDDCSKYDVVITIQDSNFTENMGGCLYVPQCQVNLQEQILFSNNTANNGAALYLDQGSEVWMHGSTSQFVNNSAALYGGAIFVDLGVGCVDDYTIVRCSGCDINFPIAKVSFVNNVAGYGGSSVYFSVSKHCNVDVNSSHTYSLMNIPYYFDYWQIINGTFTHIPTDYNYTWLNVTQFPVVTSPHRLVLHGDNIKSIGNNNMLSIIDAYFIDNKILGKPVTFEGLVLDYFEKPSAVSQYHVQCIDCSTNWTVTNTQIEIDNTSPVSVTVTGDRIVKNSNVTLHLTSYQSFYQNPVQVTLMVGLVPCYKHPGYTYRSQKCVCYHHNDVVNCYEDYNEIKRGYWFGSVSGKATTSLCPNQYCQFDHNRKKTRDGYYMLPNKVSDQCEHHRSGSACGECSPGYTLAYDSTDCISVDNCSVGMTLLVVVLTCLYWILVEALIRC